MRQVIHLNDNWKFIPKYEEHYVDPSFSDADFQTVMIPHANIELPYNNFNEEEFLFISCYRKTIPLDNAFASKRIILHFEGVMAYARIFFNGHYVCEHKGGYTPFKCDVTPYAICGSDNVLAVMVDSTEREDIPPFGFVIDYLTFGGIYREVRMEIVEDTSIDNLFIRTRNVLTDNKLLDIDIFLENPKEQKTNAQIEFQLLKEAYLLDTFSINFTLTGESLQKIKATRKVGAASLWDIDNPTLYSLSARIVEKGSVLDEYSARFGFREAIFKPDGFYLNGKKIKLRGLNRHQSFPYVGYAMPKSAQYKDAEILKYELGLNMVRLSHYPQSRHFLDRCDEIGLLVLDEIPGWQHIGDKDWQALSIKNVEEMIKKDWNRPSIVLWGVRINESQDNDAFYTQTNKVARDLDDTRQTCGIRNIEGSNLIEDVYTFNDFIHRGDNVALSSPAHVVKKKAPYLVTEHNGHMYPTKRFDNESRRIEHALRHTRVLNHMYGDQRISGSIGWCAFDYNTHKDFGSGDRICYHGVMDMFRIPKEAAAVYASQQDDKPVMEVASSLTIGEWEAAKLDSLYVFTNCDYVKLYRNGEHIGTYHPAKEAFPHLPHPPVIISDLIGNQIEEKEGFSKRDAQAIKDVLLAVVKYGDKSLPLRYKIKMGLVMLRTRMPYEKAVDYYARYIQNWGCKSLSYEFEGYMDEKVVVKAIKGPFSESQLMVIPDTDQLVEQETYDVARVVLKHTDTAHNLLTFSNEVITLEVEGDGEIIGPKKLALIGGTRAFWVKSIGRSGHITVKVLSDRFPPQTIHFTVKK